jgi:tetratricopeptide (TPR) repeat protein
MSDYLQASYLLILLGLLGGAAWFVLKQVFKTRQLESSLAQLQAKLRDDKGTTQEYYELGSIYLSKNLSVQAVAQLQKALRMADVEAEANIAPIHNALGYAYFLQEQYDLAIRNYKEALKLQPNYVTALNNLGHAYERKNLSAQALAAYEQSLAQDQKNAIAKQRVNALKRRLIGKGA